MDTSNLSKLQQLWDSRKLRHHWNYRIVWLENKGFYASVSPEKDKDFYTFLGKNFEDAKQTLMFYSEY